MYRTALFPVGGTPLEKCRPQCYPNQHPRRRPFDLCGCFWQEYTRDEIALRARNDEFVSYVQSPLDLEPETNKIFLLCWPAVFTTPAREAVAVFDWAMENMSIWASLDIESRNPKTLGRAYTCGVSNMGRYPFETQV